MCVMHSPVWLHDHWIWLGHIPLYQTHFILKIMQLDWTLDQLDYGGVCHARVAWVLDVPDDSISRELNSIGSSSESDLMQSWVSK